MDGREAAREIGVSVIEDTQKETLGQMEGCVSELLDLLVPYLSYCSRYQHENALRHLDEFRFWAEKIIRKTHNDI